MIAVSALWLFVMIVVDGVMPLVPGEAALLSQAPAAVAAGWPAVIGLGALAASGAFLGDVTAFLLGRRVGTTRFEWQKRRKVARLLDWTGSALKRVGPSLIVTARMMPGWRVAITFTAGATGFSMSRFIIASAVGSTIWATYLLTIGTTVQAVTGGGAVMVTVISVVTMFVLARAVRWARKYVRKWSANRRVSRRADRDSPRLVCGLAPAASH